MSPWADVTRGAEQIGSDYVLSAKPKPALFVNSDLDVEAAKKEINTMLSAAQKNNCSLEILMKDITSVNHNPQNLIKWEQLVMSMLN